LIWLWVQERRSARDRLPVKALAFECMWIKFLCIGGLPENSNFAHRQNPTGGKRWKQKKRRLSLRYCINSVSFVRCSFLRAFQWVLKSLRVLWKSGCFLVNRPNKNKKPTF
jgi:hypothetical protein